MAREPVALSDRAFLHPGAVRVFLLREGGLVWGRG
jgi:hypothetical protein